MLWSEQAARRSSLGLGGFLGCPVPRGSRAVALFTRQMGLRSRGSVPPFTHGSSDMLVSHFAGDITAEAPKKRGPQAKPPGPRRECHKQFHRARIEAAPVLRVKISFCFSPFRCSAPKPRTKNQERRTKNQERRTIKKFTSFPPPSAAISFGSGRFAQHGVLVCLRFAV